VSDALSGVRRSVLQRSTDAGAYVRIFGPTNPLEHTWTFAVTQAQDGWPVAMAICAECGETRWVRASSPLAERKGRIDLTGKCAVAQSPAVRDGLLNIVS